MRLERFIKAHTGVERRFTAQQYPELGTLLNHLILVSVPVLRCEQKGCDDPHALLGGVTDVVDEVVASDLVGVKVRHLVSTRPPAVAVNDER